MFEVSASGLSKLIEDTPVERLIGELVANAFDESGVTEVGISIDVFPDANLIQVAVEDDSPNGFADLTHSWTVFAESRKKTCPSQSGRFNLGDKLFISAAADTGHQVVLCTTTGTVVFDKHTGRTLKSYRRGLGSKIVGMLRATPRQVREEIIPYIDAIIVPGGVRLSLNGIAVPQREPIHTFQASLPTVLGDDRGVLRKTSRQATIEVYDPPAGETAKLFELGFPVVETGDKFHVNVKQKIPLSFSRDNVQPSYLRTIRTLVANEMTHRIGQEDANAAWVSDAIADKRATPELVRTVLRERFGEHVVAHNPSDPEASASAFAAGYTVVHGRQLSKEAWEQVRTKAPIRSASELFPTTKAFTGGPDGTVAEFLNEHEMTDGMWRVARFAKLLHKEFFNEPLLVQIYKPSPTNEMGWSACYGRGQLVFHLKRLGHKFFDEFNAYNLSSEVVQLVLHELAHRRAANHLSDEYHDALCEIGYKYGKLCLEHASALRAAISGAAL